MGKSRGAVITVSTREASLKRRLRNHLRSLGFHKAEDGTLTPPGEGKDVIRAIHSAQRDDRLELSRKFISERFSKLVSHFGTGKDVDPARKTPGPPLDPSWPGGGELF